MITKSAIYLCTTSTYQHIVRGYKTQHYKHSQQKSVQQYIGRRIYVDMKSNYESGWRKVINSIANYLYICEVQRSEGSLTLLLIDKLADYILKFWVCIIWPESRMTWFYLLNVCLLVITRLNYHITEVISSVCKWSKYRSITLKNNVRLS